MSSRITNTFAELRANQRIAFMPFLTAGDPDIQTTLELIRELGDCGADLIELGFPYSDPIADGPVIQASYTRALNNGLRVDDIFEAVATLSAEQVPPLVAMVSYALVFRNGPEAFVKRAHSAGFSGLIIPDLPGDESDELASMVQSQGLDLVQLFSPTTPAGRVTRILQAASGFVYCISIAGTTGVRAGLPGELADQLGWLRHQTKLPLAVGFGISTPDQVESLRGLADGIIVGSAIVQRIAQLAQGDRPTLQAELREYVSQMVAATRAR